ncbi:MAG: phospholipase [Deltaproteobacteria bacterium]|nr:phospholipase [Deltaproteobacteria bacterium]
MTVKIITGPLGPLTVRVVDDDARAGPPDLVVVLCHGFGAPGTDLISLARECFELKPHLVGRVRFVFPEGRLPLDPYSGGRMWWPLDMERLQKAIATGGDFVMAEETPPGMLESRKALKAMLEALLVQTRLPMSKVVVGGFSQGAMLATDVVLRGDEAPAALAILSGAPVCTNEWRRLAPQRAGLSVLQSHGTHDPILRYAWGKNLQTLLEDAGLDLQFVEFAGGHGIDGDVIEALAALIDAKAGPTR